MKIELILRNVEEVITKEELEELLEEKEKPRAYCGYEVSGPVHLGTLVAAYKQLDFLEAGIETIVLLADLHTLLNRKGDEAYVEEMLKYWERCLKAVGLEEAKFVRGSDFQLEEDYIKDVLKLGLLTTLRRARRSMQEIARDLEHARVSQMIYPLMQVVDIKALEVDIAHGGLEQRRIHMLARETLPEIGYEKPVCVHTPLLVSLKGPGEKMSSSKPETLIAVDDPPEVIKRKVRAAYCPSLETRGNPVMQICELLIFPRLGRLVVEREMKHGGDVTFESYEELERMYAKGELHPADLKVSVTNALIELFEGVQRKVGGPPQPC